MSNDKVKDCDRGSHEVWCDTQNNISELCNCIASEYIEKIENHERIVAEKDREIQHWRGVYMGRPLAKCYEIAQEQIATQKRVIEKLKEQRDYYYRYANTEFLMDRSECDAEIAAIDKGEA